MEHIKNNQYSKLEIVSDMDRFAPPFCHLFLATLPPADVREAIEDAVAVPRLLERRIEDDRLHVTLLGLGRFAALPDAVIRSWIAAIDAALPAPFRIVMDQLILRPERALVKGSEPLLGAVRCQMQLRDAIAQSSARPVAPPLPVPHVTLAYKCSATPGTVPVLPVSWRATNIVLIQSLVGRHRHVHLARWALVA